MAEPGYRGYIASRPIQGERTPQHVQNLVVRDYARAQGLTFLLSATEYAMPGCTLILEQVLDDLPNLSGIICFSLFMLPEDRTGVWDRVLSAGRSIHFALEGLHVRTPADVARIEDILLAAKVLSRYCPPDPKG